MKTVEFKDEQYDEIVKIIEQRQKDAKQNLKSRESWREWWKKEHPGIELVEDSPGIKQAKKRVRKWNSIMRALKSAK